MGKSSERDVRSERSEWTHQNEEVMCEYVMKENIKKLETYTYHWRNKAISSKDPHSGGVRSQFEHCWRIVSAVSEDGD